LSFRRVTNPSLPALKVEHAVAFQRVRDQVDPAGDLGPLDQVIFGKAPVPRNLFAQLKFDAYLEGVGEALLKGSDARGKGALFPDLPFDDRVSPVLDAVHHDVAAGALGYGGEHERRLHFANVIDTRGQLHGKFLSRFFHGFIQNTPPRFASGT